MWRNDTIMNFGLHITSQFGVYIFVGLDLGCMVVPDSYPDSGCMVVPVFVPRSGCMVVLLFLT